MSTDTWAVHRNREGVRNETSPIAAAAAESDGALALIWLKHRSGCNCSLLHHAEKWIASIGYCDNEKEEGRVSENVGEASQEKMSGLFLSYNP